MSKISTTAAMKSNGRSSVRLRYALLVLGMHRSGTSALSGVLAKLGATPPRSLMASNEFNPRGYWESEELVILHDSILQSAGSRWSDWGRFNQDWFDSPVFAGFEERLEAAIAKEYRDSPLFSVKDPRISRFLPLWLRVLARLDITPKVVVPVRHPEEVIRSLAQRDHFGRGKSQLLWLRHVLDAEFASRHLHRAFIRYEDLLEDWQSQMRRVGKTIGITWPRWSADTDVEITDFLSSELRHHRISEVRNVENSELDAWVGRVYATISEFSRDGAQDDEAFEILDCIRQEFDRTAGIYGPVVREHEFSAEREYSQMKARMDGEIEEAKNKAVASSAALTGMEQRALRAETDAKSRAGRLLLLQTDRDKLESKMSDQADQYRQLEVELQARLTFLQNEIGTGSAQFNRLQKERERLESELAALRVERDELSISLSERFHELAAFAKRMEVERREQNEVKSHLNRLQFERDEVKSCLQLERDDLRGVRQELERTQRALKEMNSKLERVSKQVVLEKAKFDAKRKVAEQKMGALSAELHVANGKLDDVLRSNTWKIGRPFRVIRRLMTGRRAKPQIVRIGDIERIRSSGAFDEHGYLAQYPDVAALKMDPIYHYLAHGCSEGRDPSPSFSTTGYYKSHPEIVARKHNALLHFLDHGD